MACDWISRRTVGGVGLPRNGYRFDPVYSSSGLNVVIAEDAQNLVTLHNVLLTNLHASDFQFI